MRLFLDAWSQRYDARKYPRRFYQSLLTRIATCREPLHLGELLKDALSWKDGKVTADPGGQYIVDGISFHIDIPKPNTYSRERHGRILTSREFFEWAERIRDSTEFSTEPVKALSEKFALWAPEAVVIPAFILHVLAPRVFPLFDQHVERARRALTADLPLNKGSNDLRMEDYIDYKKFYTNLCEESELTGQTADLKALKEIDDALMSFGKWLKSGGAHDDLACVHRRRDDAYEGSAEIAIVCSGTPEPLTLTQTPHLDSTFARRAYYHWRERSLSQGDAIRAACRDYGLDFGDLPAMYSTYPGRGFREWRTNGWIPR